MVKPWPPPKNRWFSQRTKPPFSFHGFSMVNCECHNQRVQLLGLGGSCYGRGSELWLSKYGGPVFFRHPMKKHVCMCKLSMTHVGIVKIHKWSLVMLVDEENAKTFLRPSQGRQNSPLLRFDRQGWRSDVVVLNRCLVCWNNITHELLYI